MTKTDETSTKRVTIPVGPVHPALKEPAQFNLILQQERVGGADIRVGFVHRGIEALAETRNLIQNIYLTERICGICSNCHSMCYIQAVEEIGQSEVPERAKYIRVLISEMERIQSHVLWLGVMANVIGFETLFMYAFKHREKVNDLFEELTGNRIHYGSNTIGGVRMDINSHMSDKILSSISEIEKSARYMQDVYADRTVEKRLKGVGTLSNSTVREFCLVGPAARASGVATDVRKDDPYAAYGDLQDSFDVILASDGDTLARAEVRNLEIFESANLIRTVLDEMPSGPIVAPGSDQKRMRSVPAGEAVSRVEAPRGELLHYVKTNGKQGLERLKVRSPTLANIIILPRMLEGGDVADIPVLTSSIDPCMSCTDR
jgi:NADH-quinone oxidoreductase subunit D